MSRFTLHWSARARADVNRALEWFLRENPLAGERLQQDIQAVLASLRESPHRWALWRSPSLRRHLLEGFPYFFVYSIAEPNRVTLLAFLHQRQHPDRRFTP